MHVKFLHITLSVRQHSLLGDSTFLRASRPSYLGFGGKRTFAMRRRMSFLSGGSHHKFPGEECDANSEAARVILSNIKGITIQA